MDHIHTESMHFNWKLIIHGNHCNSGGNFVDILPSNNVISTTISETPCVRFIEIGWLFDVHNEFGAVTHFAWWPPSGAHSAAQYSEWFPNGTHIVGIFSHSHHFGAEWRWLGGDSGVKSINVKWLLQVFAFTSVRRRCTLPPAIVAVVRRHCRHRYMPNVGTHIMCVCVMSTWFGMPRPLIVQMCVSDVLPERLRCAQFLHLMRTESSTSQSDCIRSAFFFLACIYGQHCLAFSPMRCVSTFRANVNSSSFRKIVAEKDQFEGRVTFVNVISGSAPKTPNVIWHKCMFAENVWRRLDCFSGAQRVTNDDWCCTARSSPTRCSNADGSVERERWAHYNNPQTSNFRVSEGFFYSIEIYQFYLLASCRQNESEAEGSTAEKVCTRREWLLSLRTTTCANRIHQFAICPRCHRVFSMPFSTLWCARFFFVPSHRRMHAYVFVPYSLCSRTNTNMHQSDGGCQQV